MVRSHVTIACLVLILAIAFPTGMVTSIPTVLSSETLRNDGADRDTHYNPDFITNQSSQFQVNIYSVATSILQDDIIDPVSTDPIRVYDVVSSSTTFTPLRIRGNISGYTEWNFGMVTNPYNNQTDSLGQSRLFGQLFVVVNDEISILTSVEMGDHGFLVNLPQGDSTVTLLYIGKDQTEGIVYATDSIVIRIRSGQDEFNTYDFQTVGTSVQIEDRFDPGIIKETITKPYQNENEIYFFSKRSVINSSTSVDLSLVSNSTQSSLMGDDIVQIRQDTTYSFILKGQVDSTGVEDLQHLTDYTTHQGRVFVIHGHGIVPYDPSSSDMELVIHDGNTFLGLLTLNQYGAWHEGITGLRLSQDQTGYLPNGRQDWEFSLASVVGDPGISGSFDFIGTIDGVRFQAFLDVVASVDTVTTGDRASFLLVSPLVGIACMILSRRRDPKKRRGVA